MYEGFHGTVKGNKIIINGLEIILVVEDTLLSYQNSDAGKDFSFSVMHVKYSADKSFVYQNAVT